MLVIVGGPIIETDNKPAQYRLGNFIGCIKTIGDIVFATGYTAATFHSYTAMKNRNVPAFLNVSATTTALGAVACFTTGLAGYLTFGADTETNVLENFTGSVGAVFKVGLVVHLLL
jgi:amino acid permease